VDAFLSAVVRQCCWCTGQQPGRFKSWFLSS